MTILWLLSLPILLTGCGANPPPPLVVTEVKVERVTPPATLLSCPDAPLVPTAPVTQRSVARYVVDLSAAGEDCRDKLNRVRAWTAGD